MTMGLTWSLFFVDSVLNPGMGASKLYLNWCYYSDLMQKWFIRWPTSLLSGMVTSVQGVWWVMSNDNTSMVTTSVVALNDDTEIWMIVLFTTDPSQSFAQKFVNQHYGLIQICAAVKIRWHTRRNQISSFGETDESVWLSRVHSSVNYWQPRCAGQLLVFVLCWGGYVPWSC
jgi:hypothetical protein